MILRKLESREHWQTRSLWEQVFSEDSKTFLDYYYFLKTRDNEIYVVEEDGAIRSMLHLNPYLLRTENTEFTGHYIVGVATETLYRKRGFMAGILMKSLEDMYSRKELFTFLMPAAEKIYTPYDFRTVYEQNLYEYSIEAEKLTSGPGIHETVVQTAEAGIGDCDALAAFFQSGFDEKFQVCAVRGEDYYRTLLLEQQSENGGIRTLRCNGEVTGFFLYGNEDGLEIREPLYFKSYEETFWRAVGALCREKNQKKAKVYADADSLKNPLTEGRPKIMVRIVHLEAFLNALQVKTGEEMDCSFAVLDPLLPRNSRIWRLMNEKGKPLKVRESEDSEGVLPIAALTSLLFGCKTVEEISEQADVFLTEHLAGELQKLQPLKRIYLNEIV